MIKTLLYKHYIISIVILGYFVLFIPFLGQVHLFDWDEINFAEASREMIVTGDWLNVQINYEPFWEKPPLFIWFSSNFNVIFWYQRICCKTSQRPYRFIYHTLIIPNG